MTKEQLAVLGTALAGLAALAYQKSVYDSTPPVEAPATQSVEALKKSLGYSLSMAEAVLHIKQVGLKYGVTEFQNIETMRDSVDARRKVLAALKDHIVYRAFNLTKYGTFTFSNEAFLFTTDLVSFVIFTSKTLYELDIRTIF